MRKRWLALALAGVMAFGVCGCEKEEAETLPSPSVEPVVTEEPTATPEPTEAVIPDRFSAYKMALVKLLEAHIDLDGYEYEDDAWDTLGDIEFAITDVDMDGERELLMRFAHTIVAGQCTLVYGYNTETGKLVKKLHGTASCRFYDNGMAQINSAHQSNALAGRFWPYTIELYDRATGKYRFVGNVDALDEETIKIAGVERQIRYPKEVDTEGAGIVYYISDTEWNSGDTPMSQSDYNTWCEETFGEEIVVEYFLLTEENIKRVCEQGDI